MYSGIHLYVDFSWEALDNPNDYLIHLLEILELVYLYKPNVYYNKKQLEDFVEIRNDWNDSFAISTGNILDLILRNATPVNESTLLFDVVFAHNQSSIHPVDNLCYLSVRNNDSSLMISMTEPAVVRNFLSVKSNTDFERVSIEVLNTLNEVKMWLNGKIKRNFNVSQKHGENGAGNHHGASVLLCNRQHAQELLETAIPDFPSKANRLFNFDEQHGAFIEFFFEGDNPQLQWHGFHLLGTDISRVPNAIKKYF